MLQSSIQKENLYSALQTVSFRSVIDDYSPALPKSSQSASSTIPSPTSCHVSLLKRSELSKEPENKHNEKERKSNGGRVLRSASCPSIALTYN